MFTLDQSSICRRFNSRFICFTILTASFFQFSNYISLSFTAQTMGMENCSSCNYEHHYFLCFIHLSNNFECLLCLRWIDKCGLLSLERNRTFFFMSAYIFLKVILSQQTNMQLINFFFMHVWRQKFYRNLKNNLP